MSFLSGRTSLTTVQTGDIAAGAITTSLMADNAVTLAKMSGGTDGNLIGIDASGDPAYIATGTNGQVLTSGGVGVAALMEDAAGGSTTLIGTSDVTGAASVTVTGLASAQDAFAVHFIGSPDTDQTNLFVRFGDSGGVDSGSSDYSYIIFGDNIQGSSFSIAGVMDDLDSEMSLDIDASGNKTGTNAGEGLGLHFTLHRPGDSTIYPVASGTMHHVNQDARTGAGFWAGARLSAITLDRVQIIAEAGNITGRLTVIGWNHA